MVYLRCFWMFKQTTIYATLFQSTNPPTKPTETVRKTNKPHVYTETISNYEDINKQFRSPHCTDLNSI